jgi:hypothetical protein
VAQPLAVQPGAAANLLQNFLPGKTALMDAHGTTIMLSAAALQGLPGLAVPSQAMALRPADAALLLGGAQGKQLQLLAPMQNGAAATLALAPPAASAAVSQAATAATMAMSMPQVMIGSNGQLLAAVPASVPGMVPVNAGSAQAGAQQ